VFQRQEGLVQAKMLLSTIAQNLHKRIAFTVITTINITVVASIDCAQGKRGYQSWNLQYLENEDRFSCLCGEATTLAISKECILSTLES